MLYVQVYRTHIQSLLQIPVKVKMNKIPILVRIDTLVIGVKTSCLTQT